jgi:hypothetical protein
VDGVPSRLNKDPLFGILRCTMRSGRTPAEASLLTQECGGIRATKGIAQEIADLPKYMSGMYSYALPESMVNYKGPEFPQLLERYGHVCMPEEEPSLEEGSG